LRNGYQEGFTNIKISELTKKISKEFVNKFKDQLKLIENGLDWRNITLGIIWGTSIFLLALFSNKKYGLLIFNSIADILDVVKKIYFPNYYVVF
jgi:hypothetical protein